jgi:Ribbon-helix-helix domain
MEDTVRWTVKVSRETDTALRTFLAQRGMKKGDISKFVEEAVRWRVLDRVVSEVKARNAGVSVKKIQAAVDDALAAVRADRLVSTAR